MCIHTLADSLLAIGECISEQDKIDIIYGKTESPSLADIEGLILVQET